MNDRLRCRLCRSGLPVSAGTALSHKNRRRSNRQALAATSYRSPRTRRQSGTRQSASARSLPCRIVSAVCSLSDFGLAGWFSLSLGAWRPEQVEQHRAAEAKMRRAGFFGHHPPRDKEHPYRQCCGIWRSLSMTPYLAALARRRPDPAKPTSSSVAPTARAPSSPRTGITRRKLTNTDRATNSP
jgi:hypothetical protein